LLTNPVFRELAHLSPADQSRALADPAVKARAMEAEFAARDSRKPALISAFKRMFELGDPPDYEPAPSTSIAARAERDRIDPFELAYDLIVADEGRTFLYVPSLNYGDGNLDAVGEMLAHPYSVPGLSDGGAHVATICDASFPTTLLAYWGRDRDRGRMEIPFLVQRHTRDTARTVGLLDRGVVARGYRADINLIDFEALSLHRPVMRSDLPAGGRRLVQTADGYAKTIVAGEITYEDGEAAGPLPGRLIRGAKPAPTTTGGTR
jgi:N-acyl-D-aspartate/D-glutamate deacylase